MIKIKLNTIDINYNKQLLINYIYNSYNNKLYIKPKFETFKN